jgi:RNA polymerase sigma factor (sigma-70 family)
MSDDPSFDDLIRRVRARDEQAAAELVRRYEPAIRVAVRVRLSDPALRRSFDSMDICQSVLANFFVRAAAGQFDLDRPERLLNLLVVMARNRLSIQVRRQRAARRDYRRVNRDEPDEGEWADSQPHASRVVAGQELLREFRDRLSEQERRLADLRALGRTWAEIAAEVGGRPDALRIGFSRAVDRVVAELRLDESSTAS